MYDSETLPKLSNVRHIEIFWGYFDLVFALSAYSTYLGTLQLWHNLSGVSKGSKTTQVSSNIKKILVDKSSSIFLHHFSRIFYWCLSFLRADVLTLALIPSFQQLMRNKVYFDTLTYLAAAAFEKEKLLLHIFYILHIGLGVVTEQG